MKGIRALIVMMLIAPVAVFAQGMGMGMGMGMGPNLPAFAEVDANSDGQVTREEMDGRVPPQGIERIFSNWDTDGDGSLSEAEFTARGQN